jgi:thiamine biosynthesis protein ThiI
VGIGADMTKKTKSKTVNDGKVGKKLLSLISGGIDSPVATYLMLSAGAEVNLLYLDNRPFTDKNTKDKVASLAKQIKSVTKNKITLYIAPHGENQKLFARATDRHVGCILCRRMMLRIAEQLAENENASALVTGDSLGQVASQTLQNLQVETQAVGIPILRPLIGFDKLEIEAIAKRIGTYEISIGPGMCCTIVPDKPSTNAKLDRILHEEQKVDIDSMVKNSVNNIEIIKL